MKKVLFTTVLACCAMCIQAKSFKIGPASSSDKMDFTSINSAMSSSSVSNGDTLYLSPNYYEGDSQQNVTKSVVIIGNGYDENSTDEGVVAYVWSLSLKADNIYVLSLKTSWIYLYNAGCTIDRCYAYDIRPQANITGKNDVYSSYIGSSLGYDSYSASLNVYNNVIYQIRNINNSDIQYNTIIFKSTYYCLYNVTNSTIKNNIILNAYSSYSSYVFNTTSGCSIEHNILSCSNSSFPTNKFYTTESSIFTCEGSYSNYYQLKPGSPALGYATDGGEVGCHGGMMGNPAGGRPKFFPYFTKVTVGSRTTDGKLPVSLNVKIQDK